MGDGNSHPGLDGRGRKQNMFVSMPELCLGGRRGSSSILGCLLADEDSLMMFQTNFKTDCRPNRTSGQWITGLPIFCLSCVSIPELCHGGGGGASSSILGCLLDEDSLMFQTTYKIGDFVHVRWFCARALTYTVLVDHTSSVAVVLMNHVSSVAVPLCYQVQALRRKACDENHRQQSGNLLPFLHSSIIWVLGLCLECMTLIAELAVPLCMIFICELVIQINVSHVFLVFCLAHF